jgi:cell division protein ZapA
MGQVVVKVNGRDFPLSCPDGQEPRIRRLAQYVDAKVGEFTQTVGQVGEARLVLLAALVIADELSDANEALQQERNRARSAGGPGRGPQGGPGAGPPGAAGGEAGEPTGDRNGAIEAAASGIHNVALRIESIAARLETP